MPDFTKTKANPDPYPGIGGYDYPRGPYGATGFRGSTSDVRNNPPAAESLLHDDYTGRRRFQRWKTFASQNGNTWNWRVPVNPDEVRATEKRDTEPLARGVPGGQNIRNTRYRGGPQATPGTSHSYRSAPNPAKPAQEVSQDSRYTYGGVNGGTDVLEDIMQERRMPYVGQHGFRGALRHAKGGIRGAVNDGTRLNRGIPILVNQGGAYGRNVRGKERHRPTVFREPAPWTSRYYDTTANTGSLTNAGSNTQVVTKVHVSPQTSARRNRGF